MKFKLIVCIVISSYSFSQNQAEISNNLGVQELNKGKYRSADSLFTISIELDAKQKKRSFLKFYNRGLARISMDSLELAKLDFDISIQLNPSFYSSFEQRSLYFYYMDRLNEALNDIDKSIELNDKNLDAYVSKILILYRMKEYGAMTGACSDGISVKKDPRFYGMIVVAYTSLGGFKMASAYLDKGKSYFGEDIHILESELYYRFKSGYGNYCEIRSKMNRVEPNFPLFIQDTPFIEAINRCR